MPANPPPKDPWLWPSSPVPLNRLAIPIQVYRYHSQETERENALEILPSIRCLKISQRMGTDPGSCVLRYAFDGLDSESPQSIADALSTLANLRRTVFIGDEIVVTGIRPDGAERFLFWGKPVRFMLGLANNCEAVVLICKGIARTAWETPIQGAYMRDADDPLNPLKNTQTDLPFQMNPRGKPNACLESAWVDNGSGRGEKYPAVIDPLVIRDPFISEKFTLASGAAALIFGNNSDSNPVITNPDPVSLKNLLVSKEPIDGVTFDVNDPSSYTPKDIIAKDRPLTGRDWPTQLDTMIRDHAFGMNWVLSTDARSDFSRPKCTLKIFAQQSGLQKKVWLQARGSHLDPELSNVASADVTRDIDQVVNQWRVMGRQKRYEASFVLAPGFASQSSDAASMTSISRYEASQSGPLKEDYRTWVFDETGEGHYLNGSTSLVTTTPSLSMIFGEDHNQPLPYARRRRPGLDDLLTLDLAKKPMKYRIAVSTDYEGIYPGVWDGTGTWQIVTKGGYKLLTDRLGIQITAHSPEEWMIGEDNSPTLAPFPGGIVQLVSATSKNRANIKPVFIRLTCVIEGDDAAFGLASKQDTTPIPETIERIVDARDRYYLDTIAAKSEFNNTANPLVVRDDSEDAEAEAMAYRLAAESGILEGRIQLGRFTNYYKIGDRISELNGRDLGFRTDSGKADTSPTYPIVESIEHDFDDKQETVLTLSDESQARHQIERKVSRNAVR